MAGYIIRRLGLTTSLEIARRSASDETMRRKLSRNEARGIQNARPDNEVESTLDEIHHAIVQIDIEGNVGIGRDKLVERRNDDAASQRGRHAHLQPATRRIAGLCDRMLGFPNVFDDERCALEQELAFASQRDGARRPLEKSDAQASLQARNRLADRGSGYAKTPPSRGEAAGLHRRDEGDKAAHGVEIGDCGHFVRIVRPIEAIPSSPAVRDIALQSARIMFDLKGRFMTTEDNKLRMERFVEFINTASEKLADELISPTATFHVPGRAEPMRGPAGYLAIIGMMRSGFPDIQWTLEETIAERDMVAARFTMRGTHQGAIFGVPATGKKIAVQAVNFYRWSDRQIVEERGQPDLLGLMQQIGAIPA